jgi:hypothetical protein
MGLNHHNARSSARQRDGTAHRESRQLMNHSRSALPDKTPS